MATKAHLEGNKRYLTEKVETIAVRVPKGEKAIIKAYAECKGKSLNGYVVDLIHADMGTENLTLLQNDSGSTTFVDQSTENE